MQNYTEKWDVDEQLSKGSVLLNIETTGLSYRHAFIYMIGLGWQEGNQLYTQCLVADNRMDERHLLDALQKALMPFQTIITYGGHSFSYLFLKERWDNYHDEDSIWQEGQQLTDIQKDMMPYKRFCELQDLKKATLERFLGFERQTAVSGKELIRIYGEWEREHTDNLKEILLKHHADDMRALFMLEKMHRYTDFWKGNFDEIDSWQIADDRCVFNLLLHHAVVKSIHYQTTCADIQLHQNKAHVSVPVYYGRLKHFLTGSVKDYYYLPAEDQAVHRSVACYVDKAYRQRATAATCFLAKEGVFLPTMNKNIEPHFQEAYQSKPYYIMYDDAAWKNNPEILHTYLLTVLS